MGNRFICMNKKEAKENNNGSRSKRMGRSQRKMLAEEEFLHRQALSMALQQHQLSQRFEGSMSRRIGGNTSSRRRTLSESLSNGKQDTNILENIQYKKFVLIHGEGFGAWCWYKTVASLEEVGLIPTALDLKGSGIDLSDTNSVTTLAEYSKPLLDYLENLLEDEKVILVGHSSGGACVSYALEHFPQKISKAIFLCATMVSDGQRPFDVFAEEDVALAMASMRPTPLGPIMEKLSLSPEKYGTGRRFFIQTLDDRALSPDVQEKLVRENPPEGVYKIKGSDHCPFFSKPQSLHKILVEIAQIP
ncbi:putative methylesterase 12 [Citrus sinensis]|uniref:Methylesterase 12 n=1 Tax=Citrus sinensis TaxID=2711 RepID=A0ACB8M5V5_CITSI|nr:putative methylesterase 12 [Citrus sinensis]